MSRKIDPEADLSELSEADLKYLHDRGRISDDQLAEDVPEEGSYSSMTKGELLDVIQSRNAGYDEEFQLPTSGKKQDLIDALVADDEDNEDDED